MTATDLPVELRKIINLLSSDKEGEQLAAINALHRKLERSGMSIHDLEFSLGGESSRGSKAEQPKRKPMDWGKPKPPPYIGQREWRAGRTYTCVAIEPYIRKTDGLPSFLCTWEFDCRKCGAPTRLKCGTVLSETPASKCQSCPTHARNYRRAA